MAVMVDRSRHYTVTIAHCSGRVLTGALALCYRPAERTGTEQSGVISVLVHLVANALALVLLAEVVPRQVNYLTTGSVVVFAIILGLLNAVLRPLLQLITLPLSCLTFGLFAFVVNAFVFYVAASLSVGVHITLIGALIGAIVVSVLNGLLFRVFRGDAS
jgi:putative membrane protein